MRPINADDLKRYLRSFRGFDSRTLDHVFESIDEMPTIRDWIPCSEELSPDRTKVLLYLRWEEIVMGWRTGNNYDDDSRNFLKEDVIAWMPLPKPYKEEQHEN